jgi:lipoyl(octanoyl) transferase
MQPCEVLLPGQMEYRRAWEWQQQLAAQRAQRLIPDRLILLEHPHTFTLGSAAGQSNLLWSAAEYAAHSVAVVQADRGGDITYHGPGQIVGYPILQLPRSSETLRADVVGYIRALEEVIINTLADYQVVGIRIPGCTGVWIEAAPGPVKVCAIGVRVNTKAVTTHGFALNVNTDLNYFGGIIPCGIRDKGVTSLEHVTGVLIDLYDVQQRIIHHFGLRFGYHMIPAVELAP